MCIKENRIRRIFSINYSENKGTSKIPIEKAELIESFGMKNDAHAGSDILKQISLLSIENIRKQKKCNKVKKTRFLLKPGDFAENITTEGIELSLLKIGDKLKIGKKIILEVSKIGKKCHQYCAIYNKIGDCIMPKQGVFAKVLKGGEIYLGDKIEVIKNV